MNGRKSKSTLKDTRTILSDQVRSGGLELKTPVQVLARVSLNIGPSFDCKVFVYVARVPQDRFRNGRDSKTDRFKANQCEQQLESNNGNNRRVVFWDRGTKLVDRESYLR